MVLAPQSGWLLLSIIKDLTVHANLAGSSYLIVGFYMYISPVLYPKILSTFDFPIAILPMSS